MDNKELLAYLAKSATSTSVGGQLNQEQYKKFIDTVKDQSEFLKKIQTITGINASSYQLNSLSFASRIISKATEGAFSGTAVNPTISPRTLNPVEVILPIDITFQFLEENIEGNNAESVILNAAGKAFVNDTLDLAMNGDTAGTGFVVILDGILKKAGADAATNKVSLTSGSLTDVKAEFKKLLAALPAKYKTNVSDLVFVVSNELEELYRDQLAERNTALGDQYISTGRRAQYKGIDVFPLPYMPTGASKKIILTPYQNIAVGYGRDLRIGRQIQERKRLIEYTMTAKLDTNYVLSDAIVVGS